MRRRPRFRSSSREPEDDGASSASPQDTPRRRVFGRAVSEGGGRRLRPLVCHDDRGGAVQTIRGRCVGFSDIRICQHPPTGFSAPSAPTAAATETEGSASQRRWVGCASASSSLARLLAQHRCRLGVALFCRRVETNTTRPLHGVTGCALRVRWQPRSHALGGLPPSLVASSAHSLAPLAAASGGCYARGACV